MDPMLSTAISFVISYIANCLPVPTSDYEGRLRKCFHNALDKWNVAQEIKDSAREVRKGLLKVDEVLNAVNQQKAELEKISRKEQQLLNRGVRDIKTYWDMWATGPNELKLTYDIVLSGRETASEAILRACNTPMYICVESSSQSDAFGFVVATLFFSQKQNNQKV